MPTAQIDGQTVPVAGIADAEAAIRRLDGTLCTEVAFQHESGSRLIVGGGPERFVIEMADGAAGCWRAVDPTKGQNAVPLVVGRVPGQFPAYRCLSLDAALEAARAFLCGERSAQLMWSMIG